MFGNFPIPYPKREFLSEDDEEKQDKVKYFAITSNFTGHCVGAGA